MTVPLPEILLIPLHNAFACAGVCSHFSLTAVGVPSIVLDSWILLGRLNQMFCLMGAVYFKENTF